MDLPELLAREGHDPSDLSALMSWARTRADELIRELDPDSPAAALLAGFARPVLRDSFADTGGGEVDAPEQLRRAVTAATTSSPQPAAAVDDDPDGGLGGFARFHAIMRMNRPYPVRQQEVDERPTLARSFALAAERAGDEAPATPAPTPASSNDLSSTFPLAAINFSGEESGNLVLGIPAEDSSVSAIFDAAIDPDATPEAPASSGGRTDEFVVADDGTDLYNAGVPSTLATPVTPDETIAESLPRRDVDETSAESEPLRRDDADETSAESEPLRRDDADETSAAPLRRRRDTPPSPGLPAVGAGSDPSAPVLRHARGPKKKVVELGTPLSRPRTGGSSKAVPVPSPRAVTAKLPRKAPPPPPPPGKKRPPAEEEIEELSRVELIDDLPPYLRDDDEE